jgi:hypothetical protein
VPPNSLFEIGSSELLQAFFATISRHLEPSGWGSRYPFLLRALYQGQLPNSVIPDARKEMLEVQQRLQELPADQVVWEGEDGEVADHAGQINMAAEDLSKVFVNPGGRNLFELLALTLDAAEMKHADVEIQVFHEKKNPDGSTSFLFEQRPNT